MHFFIYSEGEDFIAERIELFFPPSLGTSIRCATIAIVNDDFFEFTEKFLVFISSLQRVGNMSQDTIVGENFQACVSIIDDDTEPGEFNSHAAPIEQQVHVIITSRGRSVKRGREIVHVRMFVCLFVTF